MGLKYPLIFIRRPIYLWDYGKLPKVSFEAEKGSKHFTQLI